MKILFRIFLLIVIAVGVVYTNPSLFPAFHTWLEQKVNSSGQTKEGVTPEPIPASPATKKLTTELSPARGISGRWIGSKPQGATYRQSSICEYTTDIVINFTQNNNAVNGTINFTTRDAKDLDAVDFTPCPPTGYLAGDFQIQGTINGTYITFETVALRGDPSLPIKFKGTFTDNIMSGTFERMPYSPSQLAELSKVSGTWIVTKSR